MCSGIRSFLLTIVSAKPKDRLVAQPARSLTITIVGSGFPHSEIFGSKLVRSSPKLIAAYHVLHRLSVPRHPPNALKTLDRSHYQCSPRSDPKPKLRTLCDAHDKKDLLASHLSGKRQHDVSCRGSLPAPAGRSQPDECPLHHVKQHARPRP